SIVCSEVFAEIYKQIDPEVLGQDERDVKVAYEYGTRLAKVGQNIREENIKRLVHDYPSHNFVIDAEEAETLFEKTYTPSSELRDLVVNLGMKAFSTNVGNNVIVERLATYRSGKK